MCSQPCRGFDHAYAQDKLHDRNNDSKDKDRPPGARVCEIETHYLRDKDANDDGQLVEDTNCIADFGRGNFGEERRDHAETQARTNPNKESAGASDEGSTER